MLKIHQNEATLSPGDRRSFFEVPKYMHDNNLLLYLPPSSLASGDDSGALNLRSSPASGSDIASDAHFPSPSSGRNEILWAPLGTELLGKFSGWKSWK